MYYNAGDYDHPTLYRLGSSEPINPKGCLAYLYSEGGYLIAGFRETDQTDTRLLVMDQNGETVYRSADTAQRPQVDGDRLFYVTKEGKIYLVKLN